MIQESSAWHSEKGSVCFVALFERCRRTRRRCRCCSRRGPRLLLLLLLQVVLVSATLPHEVLEMTHKFMTDPVRILVKRDELTLEVRLGALACRR